MIKIGWWGFGFRKFKKRETCWAYIYDWEIRLGLVYIIKEHILTLYEKRVLKRNERRFIRENDKRS